MFPAFLMLFRCHLRPKDDFKEALPLFFILMLSNCSYLLGILLCVVGSSVVIVIVMKREFYG